VHSVIAKTPSLGVTSGKRGKIYGKAQFSVLGKRKPGRTSREKSTFQQNCKEDGFRTPKKKSRSWILGKRVTTPSKKNTGGVPQKGGKHRSAPEKFLELQKRKILWVRESFLEETGESPRGRTAEK